MQMATVLIYLAAPEEGGETVFPLEGEHGLDRLPTIDYTSCNQGLKVGSMHQGLVVSIAAIGLHFLLAVTSSKMSWSDDCLPSIFQIYTIYVVSMRCVIDGPELTILALVICLQS